MYCESNAPIIQSRNCICSFGNVILNNSNVHPHAITLCQIEQFDILVLLCSGKNLCHISAVAPAILILSEIMLIQIVLFETQP